MGQADVKVPRVPSEGVLLGWYGEPHHPCRERDIQDGSDNVMREMAECDRLEFWSGKLPVHQEISYPNPACKRRIKSGKPALLQ